MKEPEPSGIFGKKRELLTWVGRMLSLLALVYLFLTLRNHLHEFPTIRWDSAFVFAFIGSLAYWMVNQAIGVYVWKLILANARITISFRQSYAIMGRSQIGKYLPGNIFHYVGRVGYAADIGIPAGVTVASMGMEIILTIVAYTVVAFSGMLIYRFEIATLAPFLPSVSAFRLGVLAFLLVAGAMAALFHAGTIRRWLSGHRAFLKPGNLIKGGLCYAFFFVSIGIMLNVLVRGLWGIPSPLEWFDMSWRFSVAWLIGFLVPGAPGGLGIREAVMIALFGPALGEGAAAGVAITIRIITTIADLLTYGIAVLLSRD